MYIKRVTYKIEILFYSESIVKSETWNQSESHVWSDIRLLNELIQKSQHFMQVNQ